MTRVPLSLTLALAGLMSLAATGTRTLPATVLSLPSAAAWTVPAAHGANTAPLMSYRDYVAQATVLILGPSCTGFVAEAPYFIVTAAHCVPEQAERLRVQAYDGKRYTTRVDRIDRDTDLALLRLNHPLPIPPLTLATELPARRAPLLFAGRSDRPEAAQIAAVERIGRCPSLPRVDKVIFTSINARPGDSGAPVVDDELKVVGIVHGGARCHILAPVVSLARQLAAEPADPRSEA